MGLAEQFSSLLTGIVPEREAFLSSGVAFMVRDSGCWSHNNLELLDKHIHMHQCKMMAAAVSALGGVSPPKYWVQYRLELSKLLKTI